MKLARIPIDESTEIDVVYSTDSIGDKWFLAKPFAVHFNQVNYCFMVKKNVSGKNIRLANSFVGRAKLLNYNVHPRALLLNSEGLDQFFIYMRSAYFRRKNKGPVSSLLSIDAKTIVARVMSAASRATYSASPTTLPAVVQPTFIDLSDSMTEGIFAALSNDTALAVQQIPMDLSYANETKLAQIRRDEHKRVTTITTKAKVLTFFDVSEDPTEPHMTVRRTQLVTARQRDNRMNKYRAYPPTKLAPFEEPWLVHAIRVGQWLCYDAIGAWMTIKRHNRDVFEGVEFLDKKYVKFRFLTPHDLVSKWREKREKLEDALNDDTLPESKRMHYEARLAILPRDENELMIESYTPPERARAVIVEMIEKYMERIKNESSQQQQQSIYCDSMRSVTGDTNN